MDAQQLRASSDCQRHAPAHLQFDHSGVFDSSDFHAARRAAGVVGCPYEHAVPRADQNAHAGCVRDTLVHRCIGLDSARSTECWLA